MRQLKNLFWTADDVYTFANRKLIFRPSRMAEDVVELVDRNGHTSGGEGVGSILNGITRWWRENAAYLLSAPAET